MAGKQSSGGLWAINHWLKPACAQTQLHPVCLESQQKASRKAVVVVFGHFFGKLQILLLAFPTLLKNTTNTQTCQRPLGFLKGSWSVCVCVRESYLCWLQVFVISFRRKPHSLQGETECQLLSPTCVCVCVCVNFRDVCVLPSQTCCGCPNRRKSSGEKPVEALLFRRCPLFLLIGQSLSRGWCSPRSRHHEWPEGDT